MSLRAKLHDASAPLIFYEVIPPAVSDAAELEDRLRLIGEVAGLADAINIPEIREEVSRGPRSTKLRVRMEPREFAQAIQSRYGIETVVNRVTVHDGPEKHLEWLEESASKYGVRDLILVGGESSVFSYPGPTVPEAAEIARKASLGMILGGIAIPSRKGEAKRLLSKHSAGLEFFTTQVLLEASDTIALIQALEGANVRLVLSFTPLCNSRDLAFLEWLGVTVPSGVAKRFAAAVDREQAVRESFDLAKSILAEVFDCLTPRSPALGIQVERITKRNSAAALQMLVELADFYPAILRRKMASLLEVPPKAFR